MTNVTQDTVVLADDHSMFRQVLKALIEKEGFTVVAEAADGHEAMQKVGKHKPRLAVLDFNMPLLNGIDSAREILKRSPDTRLLLLTMYEDDEYVVEALKAGIRGYVLKAQASVDLVSAMREVLRGSVYLSPGISEALVNSHNHRQRQTVEPLSDRERQILQLIAEGHTTKKAASLLDVSVKTAESHRARIMQKLGIHQVAGLVRYAIRRGIINA